MNLLETTCSNPHNRNRPSSIIVYYSIDVEIEEPYLGDDGETDGDAGDDVRHGGVDIVLGQPGEDGHLLLHLLQHLVLLTPLVHQGDVHLRLPEGAAALPSIGVLLLAYNDRSISVTAA